MSDQPEDAGPTAEAEALATRLRNTDLASYEALNLLLDALAPKVQLSHRPPAPTDGLVDGAYVRDGFKQSVAEIEAGAATYTYHVDQIEAHANELHFAWRWQISLPDGRHLDYTSAVECVLQGGQVTDFISWQRATPDEFAIMTAAAELGRAKLVDAQDSGS